MQKSQQRAVAELDAVLFEPDGTVIWQYFADDVITDWELLPDALRLTIWGEHEVMLDWTAGKAIGDPKKEAQLSRRRLQVILNYPWRCVPRCGGLRPTALRRGAALRQPWQNSNNSRTVAPATSPCRSLVPTAIITV